MTDTKGLVAETLACRRDERLLFRELSFAVEAGHMLEICGRNGSGKTTLIRLMCGLRQPDEGRLLWQGQDIRTDPDAYRRKLCYVGHLSGLKADLSPCENLRADARLFDADPQGIEPALARLGLKREIDTPCRRLSAGQRQRAALARLLVRGSSLWVLDEPCASLDREAQARVQGLMEEHAGNGGMVVFTTHQPLQIRHAGVRELWLGEA